MNKVPVSVRTTRSCKISQSESLSAYLDDMLDGQSTRQISRHIDECDECRSTLDQLARTKSLLRSVRKSPTVPDQMFWANIHRAARLSSGAPTPALRRLFSAGLPACRPVWRIAALSTFAAAVIALSFLPIGTQRAIVTPPVEAAQSIDVNALVESHASITSDQPLVDHSRLTMIKSDTTAQKAGGNTNDLIDPIYGPLAGAPDAGPTSN